MPTIVGVQTGDRVVLAGDRRAVEGDRIVSDAVDRVFSWPSVCIAVMGPVSGIQATRDAFDAERRSETHHRPLRVATVERMLERASRPHGCDVIAASVDESTDPILSVIRQSDGTTRETVAALGSGSHVAFGQLDRRDWTDPSLDVEAEISQVFDTVSSRDPTTGPDVDIVTFDGGATDQGSS